MRPPARLLAVLATSLVLTLALVMTPASAGAAGSSEAATSVAGTDEASTGSSKVKTFERRVLARINRVRARHGLRKVRRLDSCVDRMSDRWARRIKRTGRFEHRDQKRVLARCDLGWAGENLVRGIGLTPAVAVKAWLGSPSHRAVLLKKRARWAGVGVRVDSAGRVIGVLNFGDPA